MHLRAREIDVLKLPNRYVNTRLLQYPVANFKCRARSVSVERRDSAVQEEMPCNATFVGKQVKGEAEMNGAETCSNLCLRHR